jgi:hypothetical protein
MPSLSKYYDNILAKFLIFGDAFGDMEVYIVYVPTISFEFVNTMSKNK